MKCVSWAIFVVFLIRYGVCRRKWNGNIWCAPQGWVMRNENGKAYTVNWLLSWHYKLKIRGWHSQSSFVIWLPVTPDPILVKYWKCGSFYNVQSSHFDSLPSTCKRKHCHYYPEHILADVRKKKKKRGEIYNLSLSLKGKEAHPTGFWTL